LRILKITGDFNVPIALSLEPGERYVIDWFCNVFVGDEEMLAELEKKMTGDISMAKAEGDQPILVLTQQHTGEGGTNAEYQKASDIEDESDEGGSDARKVEKRNFNAVE